MAFLDWLLAKTQTEETLPEPTDTTIFPRPVPDMHIAHRSLIEALEAKQRDDGKYDHLTTTNTKTGSTLDPIDYKNDQISSSKSKSKNRSALQQQHQQIPARLVLPVTPRNWHQQGVRVVFHDHMEPIGYHREYLKQVKVGDRNPAFSESLRGKLNEFWTLNELSRAKQIAGL